MTKTPLAWLVGLVLPLALASIGCGDATHAEAEAATKSWVAQHAESWEVDGTKGFGVEFEISPCTSNVQAFARFSTPRAQVRFSFDCPGNEVIDLAWLTAHARGYDLVLNLPIDAPGWTFVARSPSSSVTEGLTFESWQNEQLEVLLETKMFAVWGESHSPECAKAAMIADGPAREGCWVDVPWEGTAVVHLSLGMSKDSLRAPPPLRP